MSLASKITLASSVTFLFGSFAFVMYDKEMIKREMHKNVIRDLAREEDQRRNLADLDRQMHVEKQYREAMSQKADMPLHS